MGMKCPDMVRLQDDHHIYGVSYYDGVNVIFSHDIGVLVYSVM